MPVNGVGTQLADLQSNTGTAKATSALGKDDFLKLMMAQMGAQDPLSPMNNQEFVAQLAQFANVEALQAQSQSLDALLMAQTGANQLSSANLVGKEATFKSDAVQYSGTGDLKCGASLSAAADVVTITVKDASGNVVRTEMRPNVAAGQQDFAFSATDSTGRPLPAGKYTVSVTAATTAGKNIPVEAVTRSMINGVSFEAGYAELLLANGAKLKLSDVMQVNLPRT